MSSVTHDGPELAALYDRISDLQFNDGRKLAEMMGTRTGDAVLDVGCGTGRLAVYLASIVGSSGSVTGIDPSPYRVDIARRKLKEKGLKSVRFMAGRGEDLGAFRDMEFDRVIYSSVFHWIDDKPAALEEAYRVLKPGGRVGMNTVDKDHHSAMKQIMEDLIVRKYPEHRHLDDEFSRMLVNGPDLEKLLDEAGFRDVRVEAVFEKHAYDSAKQLFDFIEASSFGNFMPQLPGPVKSRMLEDLGQELEKMRTPAGIEMIAKMLFATATKS
jgi:Methylase involved in ubiquinone/menaquinone biosynthesis